MTITVSPDAIGALANPCWLLAYSNSMPVDTGDSIPHFDTEHAASREAARYQSDRLGTPAPQPLPSPCFLVRARCGYFLDEEGACQMHHETADQAAQAAKDYGWVLLADGTYRCDEDCDECQP
jgi:hypothetical protein